ncbi:MAG: hypothetical protein A2201_10075 [Alicyclobacillus sp. RIFOXYA1_FULL_53_8]|nr:MAG: hypothetical protein A2201_10075 [Alicyclobacillus sp. RIFOXYA1_FULL_53_8]
MAAKGPGRCKQKQQKQQKQQRQRWERNLVTHNGIGPEKGPIEPTDARLEADKCSFGGYLMILGGFTTPRWSKRSE